MGRKGFSSAHNRMVQLVTQHLKQRNYRDIRAVSGGYPPPRSVGNGGGEVAPDVSVVKGKESLQLFEVETAEGLAKEQVVEKWSALAEHAAKNDGDFWLVVPKGTRRTAEERLADLRVSARVWEV